MLGERLNPVRLDGGYGAREEARGFDEFGGHHPRGGAAMQTGTGPNDEVRAACAEIIAGALGPVAEVGEQPDKHGAVDCASLGSV